jgi:hypothetical protein
LGKLWDFSSTNDCTWLVPALRDSTNPKRQQPGFSCYCSCCGNADNIFVSVRNNAKLIDHGNHNMIYKVIIDHILNSQVVQGYLHRYGTMIFDPNDDNQPMPISSWVGPWSTQFQFSSVDRNISTWSPLLAVALVYKIMYWNVSMVDCRKERKNNNFSL